MTEEQVEETTTDEPEKPDDAGTDETIEAPAEGEETEA